MSHPSQIDSLCVALPARFSTGDSAVKNQRTAFDFREIQMAGGQKTENTYPEMNDTNVAHQNRLLVVVAEVRCDELGGNCESEVGRFTV